MNRHVALEDKLAVLQESDSPRNWSSLDDRRLCVLCDRVITGRMIDIWQDARGNYHLHCPTPSCPATPRDWFYHGPVKAQRRKIWRQPGATLALPQEFH